MCGFVFTLKHDVLSALPAVVVVGTAAGRDGWAHVADTRVGGKLRFDQKHQGDI